MTDDAFIARVKASRSHLLPVWITVAVFWFFAAQAWGLLQPIGIAPMEGMDDPVGRLLGTGLAATFTLVVVFGPQRTGDVRLRIDRDGIDWRMPLVGRRLRWEQIERIGDRPLVGMAQRAGEMLGEDGPVAGPTSVWLKREARRGLNAAGNRALGYGDINLTVIGTDRRSAELRTALQTFAPPGLLEGAIASTAAGHGKDADAPRD